MADAPARPPWAWTPDQVREAFGLTGSSDMLWVNKLAAALVREPHLADGPDTDLMRRVRLHNPEAHARLLRLRRRNEGLGDGDGDGDGAKRGPDVPPAPDVRTRAWLLYHALGAAVVWCAGYACGAARRGAAR